MVNTMRKRIPLLGQLLCYLLLKIQVRFLMPRRVKHFTASCEKSKLCGLFMASCFHVLPNVLLTPLTLQDQEAPLPGPSIFTQSHSCPVPALTLWVCSLSLPQPWLHLSTTDLKNSPTQHSLLQNKSILWVGLCPVLFTVPR